MVPSLRQQPLITGLVLAVGWVCCTQPAFGCHQTRDWIGLQGAGPCCMAGSYYSLFWHSWRWMILGNLPFANSSSSSRCGTWNFQGRGPGKTHITLWILATQKIQVPSPTLIPNVCNAALVLRPEVGTSR